MKDNEMANELVEAVAEGPTPKMMAGVIYDALRETGRLVQGDPRIGERTLIDGRFNLLDIARAALAAIEAVNWQCVPKQATLEMILAIQRTRDASSGDDAWEWGAALSAAPNPLAAP